MEPSAFVRDWLTWAFSPSISAILITLFLTLSLPFVFHFYLYRQSNASNSLPTFLLLGPSGAGKTSLLTHLSNGETSTTHTSQTPQSALATLPSSTRTSQDKYRSDADLLSTQTSSDPSSRPRLLLIDTPGHGKLRHYAFDALSLSSSSSNKSTTNPTSTSTSSTFTNKNKITSVIFVLDSAASSLTPAAEYLHNVLLVLQKRHTQSKFSRAGSEIGVLIAANKQDIFSSLPPGLVRRKLEEEVGRVREGRSRRLLDSGVGREGEAEGDDEEADWLGTFGSKEFEFEQMEEHGVHVKVVGGSVKGEKEGDSKVDEWWQWIGENL